MNLFLIRHGETTGDVEDRYGGDYDDRLTPNRREQSRRVAEQLKAERIERVFSSSLRRAQETAKLIAAAAGCEHIVLSDLRERNRYGILTGMTKAEAKRQYPELVAAVEDRLNTIEGAEPYNDFSLRIQRAFAAVVSRMANSQTKAGAIVWHGGPMRILFRDILQTGEPQEIGDCAFVELEKDGSTWRPKRIEGIRLQSS